MIDFKYFFQKNLLKQSFWSMERELAWKPVLVQTSPSQQHQYKHPKP